MNKDIKVAGLMALWQFPLWHNSLSHVLSLSDKVFLRFDINGGDLSIPSQAMRLAGDKLGKFWTSDAKWTKAGWREELLRELDGYQPDLVIFLDDDEVFGPGIAEEMVEFYHSDKQYMMFEYEAPMPSDDGRVVYNGKPYPRLPHMKLFKWKPGLTYFPYPTLARMAKHDKSLEWHAKTKIEHYCLYTKEMEASHVFNKIKYRG